MLLSSCRNVILTSLFIATTLLQTNLCNHLHSITYANGIDYYNALNAKHNNNSPFENTVTQSLKTILPTANGQAGEGLLLDQSDNLLATALKGNRQRSAKQLAGFNQESNQIQRQQEDVCLTPGCVKAAAEILKNIDQRVDPCEDFYKYSCGNWIESQVIPEDKTSVSLFSVVQDELDGKLRALIEKSNVDGQESGEKVAPIVEKMRNLYESCMNTSK